MYYCCGDERLEGTHSCFVWAEGLRVIRVVVHLNGGSGGVAMLDAT